MPQAGNVIINDGQATPVAKTFTPESVTPQVSTFADRTSGIALGFQRIAVSTSFAKSAGSVNRTKYTVSVPVTQTVNGVTSVAYTLRANVEFIFPDGSTDAQRKDVYAYVVNGLQHTNVRASLRDLDPQY